METPRRRTRSENAKFVIESVKSLGFQLNPESRLMRMHGVLTETSGIISPDAPEFETALEAERDLQVLGFVFDQASAQPSDTEFERLVKKSLKDSLLPNEDRGESKGRNAQFELFIAAVCQNAGLHPVRREEPDVTCHIKGMKFGIAAKRVKNVDNLRKHIRKAAQQIEGAKLAGVIALDTNVALNRDNERIIVPLSDNEFFVLYKRALTRFMDNFHDRIQEWVRGKGVRGLIVHDQQVRFQPDGEWSLVGMTLRVNTARENQRRNQDFRLFEKRYTKGLPNIEDV